MLKRRASRVLTAGFLMAVATSGLSACRTAPNVAAYVGDETVSVDELEAAVDDRLAVADIAAFADGQEDKYTRDVLGRLVDREVYDAAAQRYGVEVTDDDVRARITDVVAGAGADIDEQYAKAAAQGFSREDVFQSVRQQLVVLGIAKAEGKAEALSESSLRAAFEQQPQDPTTIRLGYLAVPDQATADVVLAQLTAAPESYATVAAQYPGQATLPQVTAIQVDQIPAQLAPATTAAPGTGFTVPVPELGAVVVAFVFPPATFEEARPGLEQQATQGVLQAGTALVDDVRKDLGVRFNPRFKPDDGSGVVDILGDDKGGGSAG